MPSNILSVVLPNPSLSLPFDSAPCPNQSEDSNALPVVDTYEVLALVRLHLQKPTKVMAISAKFSSQQFLRDHEEERTGSVEFFSQSVLLLAQDGRALGDQTRLSAGTHQFEAKFILPSWLPASFSSSSNRLSHRVVAQMEIASTSYLSFNLKRNVRTAVQELVVIREPPIILNSLRYWSGRRRSAATSLAIKTTRFARIDGKLKLSMRVKSLEKLESCKVDVVQEETCTTEPQSDSYWHELPGCCAAESEPLVVTPFLGAHDMQSGSFRRRKFPMPTISTDFPEPENPEDNTEDSATLSTLSLQFPLVGPELLPRYESPLVSIVHKLRIRLRFQSLDVKEIVVNIPVTLFEGSASCDDIPPYYDDIYADHSGRRSRADSVATLPLYTPKDVSSYAAHEIIDASPAVFESQTDHPQGLLEPRGTDRPDYFENWLANDRNMAPPAVILVS